MIKAKGKKRRTEILMESELEEALTKKVSVIEGGHREKQTISTAELKNIVKDTFDRMFQEFYPRMGEKERELYSDDRAIQTLRVIKIKEGARITEDEQKIPLCKNCK